MDFLIGSPFATPVGQRIERATSSSLQSEDWGLNMEICDIINETEEGPKDAARAIKKRIAGNKNFREVMLALTVLETCVKNCGHRFHVLVSTRGFVEGVLVRAIMPKNNPPMVLQDRVLSLIQAWADAFRSSPSLTGVVSVYENLRKRGLVFPTATDTVSPIHTPHKVEDVRSAAAVSALPQHPAAAPNHGGVLTTSPDRVGKLRSDLEVVRGNMTVMSEMMNELEPGQAQQSDIELLQQLYTVCKCMQDRVVELIPRLSEEGLIEELLVINDEFNTIFTRYHSFEEHCGGQDPPEQSQAAAPTCVNLIDLSPDTPTVSQPVLPAEPAQQPLSQSPVNTLSNQMADLSTGEDDEFDMFALSRSRVMAQQGNGVPCVEQSSEPDQSVAVDDKQNSAEDESPDSTPLGTSPHSDWMIAKGMIPVSQANVMDDIEKWLSIDVEDDPNDGVTSEEFDKFLELRAQAAERLPSISAASPSTASPQAQSARQQSQSPDQMSAF
ncbi:target of Myb1 membrane trafficking protein-like isoform X1 [Anguilla rostrata]|uniref:target of Myb1 membrane trafficking protein-like isoform X1 n=2 Tax=Anguilla rostrata TaxID=7938 RepID=UPI0030CB2CD5